VGTGNGEATASVQTHDMAGHQQTCKVCGRPDKFDFHVPDEVWVAVVPEEYRNRVVCLGCFDEFAQERRVDYATRLSVLWFAGRAATFRFDVARAIQH